VLQETTGPAVSTTPGVSFLGIGTGLAGYTDCCWPPDTNASAGTTQVVEIVNLSLAVFDKSSGAVMAGPTDLTNLFSGVDTSCSTAFNISDPTVAFDRHVGRWVIDFITVSSPFKFCMAVSTSGDATGTYNAYAFTDSHGLPDYPKLGVWPDAYYLSARQFNASGTAYFGPVACAADRVAMVTGATATLQCIQINNGSVDGMLPATLDGATNPPSGSPEYYLLIPLPDSGASNMLELFQFHYVRAGGSTLTGPANIAVAGYQEAGSFGGFVPQLGVSTKLDGLGFSLMYRLAYRNFGGSSPHESLLATQNVSVGSGSSLRYAPRWYEIRSPGTAPVVYQQGTYSPDATYRWTGSIAMDRFGDIALGYSVSSSSINPGIAYTGRKPGNPLGKMQVENTILSGSGSQTGPAFDQPYRWGDYSSMAVDPTDDCTFWYANEFLMSNGLGNWSTYIASFRFPRCNPAAASQ